VQGIDEPIEAKRYRQNKRKYHNADGSAEKMALAVNNISKQEDDNA
jgi:hypothetical protein